ncbi:MAG: hypothetical protein CMJ78_04215 [Planctomycetaceae bacterium]|nr:hypothetical protein [Planctomycetaceae bacterium]
MPIEVDSEIRVFSEEEFHALAEKVIGIVFGVHNDLGRLMDEEIYKQAIRRRCEQTEIVPARREVEIKVRHRDFEKLYYMDLLFAYGLMVEAKTVEKLNKAYHAQTLHYLTLAGMHHGLLVNLRPGKVEKHFVSTTLDLSERRQFTIRESGWESFNEASKRLRELLLDLLNDWGTFLQTNLYREAVVHFFGGPEVALRRIPIFDGEIPLGTHEVCLLADDTALALTALKSGKDTMKDHLQRFLGHTKLSCMQWVNMDNHDIEFQTLMNGDVQRQEPSFVNGCGRIMGAE